jgi:hypothetical protein
VKFHIFAFFAVIILLSSVFTASAQVDSVIGQVTSSVSESFAGGISGDGRFVVFESTGNIATHNPRNSDNNREIFLFDYAQRRIFQITDTKALLKNTTLAVSIDNIKVDVVNLRPVISNDGQWIAFSSNATCAYPGNPTANPPIPAIVSATNPGSFDPNATSGNDCLVGTTNPTNNLVNDGNTEMWLYQIPAVAPVADLSGGDEISLTDLSGGTFTRVTNTTPSRLPVAGTATTFPIVADDNHDSSIDDTGSAISFTSNRDLIPCPTTPTPTCGNKAPEFDNDEIYSYVRVNTALTQLTATTRGSIGNPIYNANSTITNLTAGGWRVAFLGNGTNPIPGMTGSNTDNNEEIFFVDLDAAGALGANRKQVTTTARTNPGDVVNVFNFGRRMSRDGRYIAFDSYADLANENGGTNQTSFATYIYDTTLTTNAFRRILARSTADSGASGGDIQRYPGFTDYDANREPQTVVLQTRMNIKPDGTIPATSSEGLNDVAARPAQIYSFPLNAPAASAIFTRQTKLPTPRFFLASIQPLPSNVRRRMTFNLSQTETGTGNEDLAAEVYYFVLPNVESQSASSFSYSTGASRIAVTASPVPTPSPTASPTATPTPSPSATPTPSPTPQQPAAVQGVSPGMLAILDYDSGLNQPVAAKTAVGSLERRFTLPIELAGVTMTINGAAVGLKTVGRRQIVFVVPPGLTAADAGTVYPVVVNNNGVVFKGNITVVPARPDIFTDLLSPGPGGRARVFNATNRVLTREPFTIRTFRLRGSRLVPTVLRVYLTGVHNRVNTEIFIRIGNVEIPGASPPSSILSGATLVEPGVYTVDFTLPSNLAGAGDQPIIVRVRVGGIDYFSRLDDTAPRLFIL